MEEEKRKSDRELRTLYAVAFGLQYIQGMEKMMGDLLFQLHSMLHMDFSFIHLFDRGRRTRMDLAGHAVIHTAPNVRKVPVSAEETIELYAFMEAADESKRRGGAEVTIKEVMDKARQ